MKHNELYSSVDADQIIAAALKCLEDRMAYATGENYSSSATVLTKNIPRALS